MRKFSLHIFFTAMLGVVSVSYAASNVEQMDAKITARVQALMDDLGAIGDDLGSMIECGNEAKLDAGANCRHIDEQNPDLTHYVVSVPSCGSDEFLVKESAHRMGCKLVTDFDYEHSFDPISGTVCSGTAPAGENYCSCGKWVSKAVFEATTSCSSPAPAPASGTWYWDGSKEVGNDGKCSFEGASCSPVGSQRVCCGSNGYPNGAGGCRSNVGNSIIDPVIYECRN